MSITEQPWKKYIYSPASRNPRATKIFQVSGNCKVREEDDELIFNLAAQSAVSLDFEVEVGGHLSFDISVDDPDQSPIALSFSESPLFVGPNSDDTGAVPTSDYDKAYTIDLKRSSEAVEKSQKWISYRMPEGKLRGGFRFATLTNISQSSLEIKNVRCDISFAPDQLDLRDYSGYFHCDDELLNRIWYAGAYTVQTNIVPNNTGRFLPQVKPGWNYSAPLGQGSPILVDGAKRDRAIWPGDMGISIPSCLLAFGPDNGWPSVKNALGTVFHHQHDDGQLIFAGPATMSFKNGSRSLTYHFWSLVACVDLWQWGGEQADFILKNWNRIARSLDYSLSVISSNGLIEQHQLNDWGRDGSGGYNAAVNALAYRSLSGMSMIAKEVDPEIANTLEHNAGKLSKAFNEILWDDRAGQYRDHENSTIYPQDGNSLALAYGLAIGPRAKIVSRGLEKNWNQIGPVCPELEDTISPFISSIEVNAHFVAGEPDRAIELIRRTWGYILNAPQMNGSTLVEGMTANGSLSYRANAGYNNDPAYISLSHSWSSGPTSSLIYHLLGLTVKHDSGSTQSFRFAPNPSGSDIKMVQGGFESTSGKIEAKWTIDEKEKEWVGIVNIPAGLKGIISIPSTLGEVQSVLWNGENHDHSKEIEIGTGGQHTIKVKFGN